MLQPISDALKLLTKEFPKFIFIKIIIFFVGPLISISLIILCWGWYDYSFVINSRSIKLLIIISIIRISVYGFLLIRWGSNSKYSLIGGHRAVAQVISYEVCLVLFILVIIYIRKSFSISNLSIIQKKFSMILFVLPLFFTWIILCMAETNRTPFDLAEGESEIVSGFNIEYGGGLFAFIFIREYGIIIFLSFISSLLFINSNFLIIKTFLFCFMFVWIRCCFPRVRYDVLIIMSWKVSLPFSLSLIMISLCF